MLPQRYQSIIEKLHSSDISRIIASSLDQKKILRLSRKLGVNLQDNNKRKISKFEIAGIVADKFRSSLEHAHIVEQYLDKRHLCEMNRLNEMKSPEIDEYLKHKLAKDIGASEFYRTLWALFRDERSDVFSLGFNFLIHYKEKKNMTSNEDEDDFSSAEFVSIKEFIDVEDNTEIAGTDITIPKKNLEKLISKPEILIKKYQNLLAKYLAKEREIVNIRRKDKKIQDKRKKEVDQIQELRDTNLLLKQEIFNLKEDIHKLNKRLDEKDQIIAGLKDWEENKETMTNQIYRLDGEREQLCRKLRLYESRAKEYDDIKTDFDRICEENMSLRTVLINTLEDVIEERESLLAKLNRTREEVAVALKRVEAERSLHLSKATVRHAKNEPVVGVFVDVQNMFYAARKRFNGKLNYQALLEHVVRNRRLGKAVAYIIQTPDVDQSSFVALLDRCGYTVKSKELKTRLDGSAKGDWDMEIAMDIISTIQKIDIVVLVSGDGDFVPLVRFLKKHGLIVEVSSFEYNTAIELRECVNRFIPIDESLILES